MGNTRFEQSKLELGGCEMVGIAQIVKSNYPECEVSQVSNVG